MNLSEKWCNIGWKKKTSRENLLVIADDLNLSLALYASNRKEVIAVITAKKHQLDFKYQSIYPFPIWDQ
jgi:hypothetical protein